MNQDPAPSSPPQTLVTPQQPVGNSPEPAAVIPANTSGSKATAVNANSTQNSLQISEVRDGIVIMNDGTFRAVIMCKSVNFDLMSAAEREAVEFSYQGFLNSLYFPIQIFVRSQKIDLRPYLEKLEKMRTAQDNMLLALLMEDYLAFLTDISSQANIMDKKFYVVIRFPDDDDNIRSAVKQSTGFFTGLGELIGSKKSSGVVVDEAALEKAKTELRNRVQAVMSGLQQCGVQSLPLDTQELIELYYDAYNPDTATRQQLKNFNELSSPDVEKATSAPAQPAAGGAA